MESMDGYRRAALVLAAMESQDREWLLGELDEEDRRRICELLQSGGDITSAQPQTNPSQPANRRTPAAVIEAAASETLEAVLTGQPDWAVALVLAQCRDGAALERFLAQLPAMQVSRIRAAAQTFRRSIKPKVAALVLAHFAARIEQQAQSVSTIVDFPTAIADVSGG